MPVNTNCLYTTVQNLTGVAHSFGFLGAHGRRLGPNEQYSEFGNLTQKVATRYPWSRRRSKSLENSLKAGRLAIIKTPLGVLKDATTGSAKSLTLTNGTLGVADPCWGTYLGVLTGAFTALPATTASAVASATITFTAPVSGFTVADLRLTRAGSPVTISGVTVTTSDNKEFTVNGLTSLTGTAGAYILSVPATGSGIVDIYNNALSADASVSWTHT